MRHILILEWRLTWDGIVYCLGFLIPDLGDYEDDLGAIPALGEPFTIKERNFRLRLRYLESIFSQWYERSEKSIVLKMRKEV